MNDYLQKLCLTKNKITDQIQELYIELDGMDSTSANYTAEIIENFKLPADVALLTLSITHYQIQTKRPPNPMKILSTLSKNDRQNVNIVYPIYEETMQQYGNKNYIKDLSEQIKKEKKMKEINYLIPDKNDYILINPMRVPKQAWLMKIYANSYDDYCNIIRDTIQDFKNNNMTIFLSKPDVFNEKIKTQPFAVAFSVLVNDKFSFMKLNHHTIELLDQDNIANPQDKIKISGRVFLDIVLFGGEKFTDENGRLLDTKNEIIHKIKDENDMMQKLEDIGDSDNIVKYYIEIMTGLPMKETQQIYKSILFNVEDEDAIMELVERYDIYNLDFVAETNEQDYRILFIHKSHMRKLIKEIILNGIPANINPSFDELKINEENPNF